MASQPQFATCAYSTLGFVMAAVLYIFLVKIRGADWKIAGPFFAAGILLMLLWTPRLSVPPRGH